MNTTNCIELQEDDWNMTTPNGFEFLDHPADVWVHARGENVSRAFEQCVYGLMKTMVSGFPDKIVPLFSREIEIKEVDKEGLLVGFLSEFLYLFDVDRFVVHSVEVNIHQDTGDSRKEDIAGDGSPGDVREFQGEWLLKATARGEEFDPIRHEADVEVKAITYSYLEINESGDGCTIKIVYDI